ncbi:MAG: hypothetical protein ABSA04_08175 [Desulfobaccales bacterium]|jgi:hypothetical protein
MKKQGGIKITTKVKRRFKDAEKDYRKLLEEIMPFVKEKKTKPSQPSSRWVSSRLDRV